MPFGLGVTELVLIFAVLLLFFGAKRLPELASGMGKGIRDFRRSLNGLDDASLSSGETPAAAPAVPPAAEAEPKRLQG